MTLVNTQTGELVEPTDPAQAERRAMKISLRLDTIADNYAAVMPMLREAISLRDDIALGYRSPGDYVSDRFGAALSKLSVELRRGVVHELTEAGLSTRAIAPIVGVSNFTVSKDQSVVSHLTPASHTPESADGGEAVADSGDASPAEHRAAGSDGVTAPETIAAAGRASVEPPRPAIVGIDGKTYPASHPHRARPSKPAETTLNTIESLADRAARAASTLTTDQIRRVKPNAAEWTGGIRRSVETLQGLLAALEQKD